MVWLLGFLKPIVSIPIPVESVSMAGMMIPGDAISKKGTPWMNYAVKEIGEKEINGVNSKRIISYFNATTLKG